MKAVKSHAGELDGICCMCKDLLKSLSTLRKQDRVDSTSLKGEARKDNTNVEINVNVKDNQVDCQTLIPEEFTYGI